LKEQLENREILKKQLQDKIDEQKMRKTELENWAAKLDQRKKEIDALQA